MSEENRQVTRDGLSDGGSGREKASTYESQERPTRPAQSKALAGLYWLVWFLALPIFLAGVLIWLLTPGPGMDHEGLIGLVERAVRDQPVPLAIAAFTMFEMAFWTARESLPLASHAHPPVREDLPAHLKGPVERAYLLLEEADSILTRYGKDLDRHLSPSELSKLHADLDALRAALTAERFDEETFIDVLVKADGEVDIRLGRWRKGEVREYLESILIAVGIALALRSFVIEAFKIPSGSMIPTLQVGDHIFVNKFIYGPAIPWTNSRVWTSMPPNRGDVTVFAFPENPEQDFIKRVVGLPGDRIEIRNGHPWINGWEVPHCFVGIYSYSEYDSPIGKHEGELFVEYLGGQGYLTLYDRLAAAPPSPYLGPYIVKDGETFVMGDNRNNSHDSRMWWGGQGGGVPFANVRGRALFVWLSIPESGLDRSRIFAPVMGHPRLPLAMQALVPAMDKCFREMPSKEKSTPPVWTGETESATTNP